MFSIAQKGNSEISLSLQLLNDDLQCPVCGRSFTRKDNLKAHLKIHLEEPQHVCNLCNKKYRRRDCLKYHLMTHHKAQMMWSIRKLFNPFAASIIYFPIMIKRLSEWTRYVKFLEKLRFSNCWSNYNIGSYPNFSKKMFISNCLNEADIQSLNWNIP